MYCDVVLSVEVVFCWHLEEGLLVFSHLVFDVSAMKPNFFSMSWLKDDFCWLILLSYPFGCVFPILVPSVFSASPSVV